MATLPTPALVLIVDVMLVFLSWWLGGPSRAAKKAETPGEHLDISWHFNGLLILAAALLLKDIWEVARDL